MWVDEKFTNTSLPWVQRSRNLIDKEKLIMSHSIKSSAVSLDEENTLQCFKRNRHGTKLSSETIQRNNYSYDS